MSCFILIDPALLLPPDSEDKLIWGRFWLRLMGWEEDRRLRLGPATHRGALHLIKLASEEVANFPPHTVRERRSSLLRLMGRVASLGPEHKPLVLVPQYRGSSVAHERLLSDVAATRTGVEPGLCAIATEPTPWEAGCQRVSCNPPP